MAYVSAIWGEEDHSLPSQEKSITATTSQQIVTPDSGYALTKVTVNPQQHSESYTPAANTSANDMGAVHNKRYVNTSGLIRPSGNYNAGTYTTNGSKSISGLSSYASTSFNINIPVNMTWKSLWSNYELNRTQAAGTIVCGEWYTYYDYIAIKFKGQESTQIYILIFSKDEWIKTADTWNNMYGTGPAVAMDGTTKAIRLFRKKFVQGYSDEAYFTSIIVDDCYKWNSSTKANKYCLPVEVWGIGKEYTLPH